VPVVIPDSESDTSSASEAAAPAEGYGFMD
jgi:hypothetical protein